MIDTKMSPVRDKGRPREFATDEAVKAAECVFCQEGYEGASLAMLTNAMRINPPSFYAAFGSKESLFLRVLDDYHRSYENWLASLFDTRETTLTALSKLLTKTAQIHIAQSPMKGCLLVNSAIYTCRKQEAVARHVQVLVNKNDDLIIARLERGKREGDLSAAVDSKKIAHYVNGLIQAMAVTARASQSKEAVCAIAETGSETLAHQLTSP